jgi:hypothetical protein
MQTIKNSKNQIYNFRSYIDVDLKKEIIENMGKIMGEIRQKLIENTGIPANRLRIDLGSTEGDIGIETVWDGNKIVDNNKIKGNYNDKG